MADIVTKRQTIRVTDVADVQVSAIEDSDTAGKRLRAIRIFGVDDLAGVAVFELQLEGDTDAAIRLTTPEVDF